MANHHSRRDSQNPEKKLDLIEPRWITNPDSINDEVVAWAEKTGEHLARNGLTSATIRRFFGEMRRIQSDFNSFKEDVAFLKAKLAYDVGRGKGYGVKAFYEILKPGIEAVNQDKDNFNRFVKICEAIVAYHKFHYEGKDD